MKLSVLPVSLFSDITSEKMSIAEWAAYAQSLGTDGFDISSMFFKNHTTTYIQSIQEELKQRGVTIQPTMVCCYPDFTNPDPVERQRQIDFFNRDVALASLFGFKYIRTTAGMAHEGLTPEQGAENAAECFRIVNETAARYGVTLCLENHAKPGAWPRVDFTFDPECFFAIYEKVKDLEHVGLNFDTANAVACGANLTELLEKVIDKVVTIHMNDTSTVGTLTSVLVGTGLVNFDEVFEVLRKHNWDGWICIEEASGLGKEGSRRAVEFARKYI